MALSADIGRDESARLPRGEIAEGTWDFAFDTCEVYVLFSYFVGRMRTQLSAEESCAILPPPTGNCACACVAPFGIVHTRFAFWQVIHINNLPQLDTDGGGGGAGPHFPQSANEMHESPASSSTDPRARLE